VHTISNFLESDHKRCDGLFMQTEASVVKGQWEQAEHSFACFCQALERHMTMEENVMFPAFEKAIGSRNGPTVVLRTEHQHFRGILQRLVVSIQEQRANDFFDHTDTLRIMLQQHNLKEEGILHPMVDRILSGKEDEIIGAMDAIRASNPDPDVGAGAGAG
jgi:iron-sulfur cluster repair protein YtfE (RIC family)